MQYLHLSLSKVNRLEVIKYLQALPGFECIEDVLHYSYQFHKYNKTLHVFVEKPNSHRKPRVLITYVGINPIHEKEAVELLGNLKSLVFSKTQQRKRYLALHKAIKGN